LTLSGKVHSNADITGKVQKNSPEKANLCHNLFYKFVSLIIKFIVYINGGLIVTGRDKIPLNGGVIIASNHVSYLDPPILGAVMPRRAIVMARKGLFNIPLLGLAIKLFAFPVDRERTLPSTIKDSVKRLKNGELLIMFPEGRRSETEKLLEGKRGIGMIAGLSKSPVVPALITGSNKALPFGARWLKRARISVVFGNPVYPGATHEKDKKQYEDITQKIMFAIGELKKHHADNSS